MQHVKNCRASLWSSYAALSIPLLLLLLGAPTSRASNGNGLPCLYEGVLRTDSSWYGYLANITIMTSGAMLYEFSYPADRCCHNILFYSDDQMAIISDRMNCFQKENLLRPEDDQVLRLTPRFSWSGCRMTHPNSIPTLSCSGGRSFSSTAYDGRPTTWYVAVSNCVGLNGLHLNYRLEVYGHIGDCKTATTTPVPTVPTYGMPTPKAVLVSAGKVPPPERKVNEEKLCIIESEVNVTSVWYGFLANMTLKKGGGFRFEFSYPAEMKTENVILYTHEDVNKIRGEHSCWQKEGIVRRKSQNVPDQIIDLNEDSSWNGCRSRNFSQVPEIVCSGERRFDRPRMLHLALSHCRSNKGLFLRYRLEVSGFVGDLCSGASSWWRQHVDALNPLSYAMLGILPGASSPLSLLLCCIWWFCVSSSVICLMQGHLTDLWPLR